MTKLVFTLMAPFDKLMLFLWNQFSLKKIWATRVLVLLIVVDSVMFDTVVIKTIMIGSMLLLQWNTERFARYSVSLQNAVTFTLRGHWLTGGFLLVVPVVGIASILAHSFEPYRIPGDIVWFLYFYIRETLIPTEPPKRWKLKLPKFSLNLNLHPPVPQGA